MRDEIIKVKAICIIPKIIHFSSYSLENWKKMAESTWIHMKIGEINLSSIYNDR